MNEYEITKNTYDTFHDFYAKRLSAFNWEKQINEFVKTLTGKKVLDAGCGLGRDVNEFLKRGMDVTGIDYSSTHISTAKKTLPHAKLFEASILDLGFLPAKEFDGVWSCATLLHLKKSDFAKAITELKRILKPKGRLFISVKEGFEEKMVEDDGGKRFFSFYTQDELKKNIEKAGFKVTKIELLENKALTGKEPVTEIQKPRWICLYAENTDLI